MNLMAEAIRVPHPRNKPARHACAGALPLRWASPAGPSNILKMLNRTSGIFSHDVRDRRAFWHHGGRSAGLHPVEASGVT